MNYMSGYINGAGLWDVKPGHGVPTGNDGWIITAYAAKAGLEVHYLDIQETFQEICDDTGFPVMRLPGRPTPPPSRDVMLGLKALGFISVRQMEERNWNFSPYPLPRFSLIGTIRDLINMQKKIKELNKLPDGDPNKKPRDVLWKDGGFPHMFRFAFMVPFQDRASYYRAEGKKAPFIYRAIEALDLMFEPSSDSSKLLSWVKHGKWPSKELCERYFGKEHPITKVVVDESF